MSDDLIGYLELLHKKQDELDKKIDNLSQELRDAITTTRPPESKFSFRNLFFKSKRNRNEMIEHLLEKTLSHARNNKYLLVEMFRRDFLRNGLVPDGDYVPEEKLESKICHFNDFCSEWYDRWSAELNLKKFLVRANWEKAYIVQALFERGLLENGNHGLGFGCGTEPLPSLFAKMGINVTLTDAPPEHEQVGLWDLTASHSSSLRATHYPEIVDYEIYEKKAELKYLDMNNITSEFYNKYDFCWSACAMEHLGGIKNGLDFLLNTIKVLKPGGISVHTTEYNFLNSGYEGEGPLVFFHKKHFEEMEKTLKDKGHFMEPINFDIGTAPLDRYIDMWDDVLPYKNWNDGNEKNLLLKLVAGDLATTSVGVIIRKGDS